MKRILFLLNLIAFIASILWMIIQPGYEPLISSVLTLSGLITFYFVNRKKDQRNITMKQKSGNRSKQYQSAGDMIINKHE